MLDIKLIITYNYFDEIDASYNKVVLDEVYNVLNGALPKNKVLAKIYKETGPFGGGDEEDKEPLHVEIAYNVETGLCPVSPDFKRNC